MTVDNNNSFQDLLVPFVSKFRGDRVFLSIFHKVTMWIVLNVDMDMPLDSHSAIRA